MSHTLDEVINIPNAGIGGDHLYPPQSAPAQPPQDVSNFIDGSGPIFSMYLEMATEEDKKIVENWKADADGILIFTGLFSAAVASFISVSIQDIRQDPQDTSNFYLANIYQTLADPSRSNVTSSLPASPPPFSPPTFAVWVNALWILSLVISLTCALLATLLQQWARKYLKVTQSRYSLHKRARIRAYLAEGTEKLLLSWTIETLPTLLHISLFLFFGGLVVFLRNVDLTIFKLALSWVSVCTALYGCITFIPILRHDSPYHTPLSLPAWHIVTGIRFLTCRALRRLTYLSFFSSESYVHYNNLTRKYGKWVVQGMQKTVEESALISPSEIDTRALLWTFDCLDEDHELERFFSGLPGFRSSKVVVKPLSGLAEEGKQRLFQAILGFLNRTFSSDLLPKSVQNRRAIICANAIPPAEVPNATQWILHRVIYGGQHEGLCTAEFDHFLRDWAGDLGGNQGAELVARAILDSIVALATRRNDSWFILASNALGIPEAVLRDYAADGDSLSLAILIHVIRQQFSHFGESSWPSRDFSGVLFEASKLNVQDTSPELQHEFCALWNQIVPEVQDDLSPSMTAFTGETLRPIRNVYLALHQGTDSAPTRFSASTGDWNAILWGPSSYPVCNVPGHHPDSTRHIHDDSASHVRAVPQDRNNSVDVPSFPADISDTPSSAARALLRVDESLAVVLPLDNNMSLSVSLRPVDQATTESGRIPATSLNPVTTLAIRESIDTPARTTHPSSPDPSASTPPPKSKASTSPLHAVAVEHTPVGRTPSLDVPSSHFPTQVHRTEPYPSMLALGAPDPARPGLSSAPDLGAIVIREDIMATPAPPPQLPSPPDVSIADPSHRSLDNSHTRDHPPHPSNSQYDIV